jgi:heme A synthase
MVGGSRRHWEWMHRVVPTLVLAVVLATGAAAAAQIAHSPAGGTHSSEQETCPESIRTAHLLGIKDGRAFKKKYPSGTWVGFKHLYGVRYRDCRPFIRRAYFEAALGVLQALPVKSNVPGRRVP